MSIIYSDPEVHTLDSIDEAARYLNGGGTIQWQPGDATNYELTVVSIRGQEYLIGTTVRFVLPGNAGRHPKHLVRYLPRGSWRGLRPLLVAADWAVGGGPTDALREQDRRDEATYRRELTYSERDLHDYDLIADARLGAMVRHELEAQGWQPSGRL